MIVIGTHVPVTLMAQLNGFPFEIYSKISSYLTLFCIALAVVIIFPEYKCLQIFDIKVTILIIILGMMGAAISLVTNRHSSDDYFYIPNAVHFLENPSEKLDFIQHYYKSSDHSMLSSYNQGTSLTYEYFQAGLAHNTQTNFLNIYYIYCLMLMGFLVPISNFLMISEFTNNSSHAFAGTIIVVSVLLVLNETGRTFGTFAFPKIFQGKGVFMSIGIPSFIAFSISYFKNGIARKWFALFFTTTALIGMTSTAALMIPMLALVLFLTNWSFKVSKPFTIYIASRDVMYILSISSSFIYVAFLFIAVKCGNSVNPLSVQGSMNFVDHVRYFIEPTLPITPVLVAIFTIGIFSFNGWQRKFLSVWILLLIVLILNPLSAKILVGTVVPPNIYWRLFYLYPFPLVVGIVGAKVWRRLEVSKHRNAGAILIFLVLCLSSIQYIRHFYQRDQIQLAGYKIPPADLALAQEIAHNAPDGLMLSPPNIYGLIPMLVSNKPQVRMRGDSRAVVERKEYFLTIRASRFVGGETRFQKEFFELVSKKAVDVLVIKSTLLLDKSIGLTIRQILESNGYINQSHTEEYTIIWRQLNS